MGVEAAMSPSVSYIFFFFFKKEKKPQSLYMVWAEIRCFANLVHRYLRAYSNELVGSVQVLTHAG